MKKVIIAGFLSFSLMSIANAMLTRDAATQTIIDNKEKLQWEDDTSGPVKKTWAVANKHCNDLNFASHDDWRLPTSKELLSLAKGTKVKFGQKPILVNLPTFDRTFWTSETFTFGESAAKAVEFGSFSSDYGKPASGIQRMKYVVRCVRDEIQ